MAEGKKSKLAIHHSNLFYPKPHGISRIARSPDHSHLAAIKAPPDSDNKANCITLIDIYEIQPKSSLKLLFTITEAETITGITWLNCEKFLTSSREQTINIYSVKKERKEFSQITDYGPITSLKYSSLHQLLITGTEYGYVATYRLNPKYSSFEATNRMVKINNKIRFVDFSCQPRETASKKKVATSTKKTSKRKRQETSDEDDSEEEGEHEIYLHDTDVTIFGASEGDVIAWDYHRKTIVETMRIGDPPCTVNCLATLRNGDIVAGDSTGAISILDRNTFTCKLSSIVLQSEVLCITECVKKHHSRILISGHDPTIVSLSNANSEDYVLQERYTYHTHTVTDLLFLDSKRFVSASIDGQLVIYKTSDNKENGKTISKLVTPPHFKEYVKFSDGQMMIQENKSLKIWSLPLSTISSPRKGNSDSDKCKPTKLLLIKSKTFIYSSTFTDRWIVYSTDKGLYIFDRADEKLKSYRTSIKIPASKTLAICSNNRLLFAASQRSLYVIDLHSDVTDEARSTKDSQSESTKSNKSCKLVAVTLSLKSCIQQMLFFDHTNQLVVSCARPKNVLYSISIDLGKKREETVVMRRAMLPGFNIRFMTYNAAIKRDRNVYLYTSKNHIMRVDLSQNDLESAVAAAIQNGNKPDGIPDDANILGMIIISRDQCIIFDDSHLFKVDLISNKVVNQNSDYAHIVNIDNFLYQKSDHVALAELRHDDYIRLLPPITVKLKNKFGDA